MKHTLLALSLALACGFCAQAKKQKNDVAKEVNTELNESLKAKVAGCSFFGKQTEHWRGFETFHNRKPLTTVNLNVTMDFDYYNAVVVRLETIPVGVTSPDDYSLGDVYTKTFTYEIVNGELVVDKFAVFSIAEDGKSIVCKANAGTAYPLLLMKR